jgi:dimethylglycine dehydrogenase
MDNARVVIIGGGIAGCSAAHHLAALGCSDVILFERDELTSGSTWHAAGNVPTFSGSWTLMKMQAYSAALYRQLAADPEFPITYHVTGSVRLAHTDERMAEFRRVAGMARAQGMDYAVLDCDALLERYPLLERHDLLGALWDPLDGDIDPSQVTQALARAARSNGVQIRRFERVVALEQGGNGWNVTTQVRDGSRHTVSCQTVINAAGYRAAEVMALLGRHLPVAHMSHQYLVTEEIPELVARSEPLPLLRDPDTSYYLRQERGSYLLGPYEWDATAMWREGVPDEFANMLWANEIERLAPQILDAGARVPVLAEAGIARVVNGPIPYSPDGNPYIGPEHGLTNFWHCNTFSFGIAQGGGAGKAIAEWVLHGRPEYDLWAVDRRRYRDEATTQYTIDKAVEVYQNEYAVSFPFEERPAGRPAYTSTLYDTLRAKGARFGARAGWERPLWFDPTGVVGEDVLSLRRRNAWRPLVAGECAAVRTAVGVLDLPGFSKFEISGRGAEAMLDHLLCSRLPQVGRVGLCYALLPDGKLLSELTVSRLAADRFYAVGAASAEWHDLDLLASVTPNDGSVAVVNRTAELGTLVVAGPRSREVLAAITDAPLDNSAFPWLAVREINTVAGSVRALRVNYVGELGWELHAEQDQLPALYDAVWAAGAGLGLRDFGIYAVDSLRLDKCYRGWKADLEIAFSPFDAGLQRFVALDKGDFVGRDALLEEQAAGSPWRFVAMQLDEPGDADAPFCASIFNRGAPEPVGIVTSGGWSFTLDASIVLGYVRPTVAEEGNALEVDVLGERRAATVVAQPIYDPTNARPRIDG